MTLTIIRASQKHLHDVAVLFDKYRQFGDHQSDLEGACEFLQERLLKNDSVIFLAYHESVVVGFTQLYPSFSSGTMRRIWILNDLFVAKPARKKGIATLLIDEAKRFAEKTDAIRLELDVAVSNQIAQSLYIKSGWKRDEDFWHFEYEL